ncbi:MAG: glycosyltransferase family 4 protein [Candidatus Woesebacteria bacterium]|nr:MAG: glycosyltransferase family 4 protein [Candidatus Woesebacteria bacterium]
MKSSKNFQRGRILLVSHVYHTESGPVYGPFNVIKDFLNTNKRSFQTIEYPLVSRTPLIIKSVFETVKTVMTAAVYKPKIFIGIDPLNAFAGVILERFGLVKKVVFYCVDYTPTRFKNKILNSVYLGIDKFVSKNSDEVWNVSSRIVEVRKKQGISDSKIKFVPNAPIFGSCPRLPAEKVNRNNIVMVAGLTHGPVLDLVLKAFKNVVAKFSKARLLIIGTGPYQDKLRLKTKKMGLSENIKFSGQLPNKNLLHEVSKSGIALAIYTFSDDYSWIYYGDSKKAREYLACGTPVIITDVVATAGDVRDYNAGLVIKPNSESLEQALSKILGDKNYWLKCRKNAAKLGKDYDIDSILGKII